VAQRLDEIRALTGVLSSFRSGFAALHADLGAAREAAAELQHGLAERLEKLDRLPDPRAREALIEQRIETLDRLAARLETLASAEPAPARAPDALLATTERLEELARRVESTAAARAPAGEDELARLYERILELAETLGSRSPAPDTAPDGRLAGIEAQLESLASAVGTLGAGEDREERAGLLDRLDQLAAKLERGRGRVARVELAPEDLVPVLARLEALALRMEEFSALPELPPDAVVASEDMELRRELEELRVGLACEQESRRRIESELEGVRERLRASELARVELETRHATELTQMADHVGRQIHRLEDDLKKKKRGMAELTQQNIALQQKLTRLQPPAGATGAAGSEHEPPPALPANPAAAATQGSATELGPG
jgi:chromosome segregation ATPase